MADTFIEFWWRVPADGFHWMEMERVEGSGTELALTEVVSAKASAAAKRYAPLREKTALFRTFAATPPTKTGILGFANKYGKLRHSADAFLARRMTTDSSKLTGVVGETLTSWQDAIRTMHYVVTLWDIIGRNDMAALSQLVRWQDVRHLVFKIDNRWVAAPDFPSDLRSALVPGEIVVPALLFVQHEINRNIYGAVSPAMLFDFEANSAQLKLYMRPDNLLSALWLQFAQAVTGNKEYRQCRQCGAWYEILPGTTRSDRAYCSNACRSKAYRSRLAERRHQ